MMVMMTAITPSEKASRRPIEKRRSGSDIVTPLSLGNMKVKSLDAPALLVERHQSLPTIAPPWPFLIVDANWVRNIQSQPQVKGRVGGARVAAMREKINAGGHASPYEPRQPRTWKIVKSVRPRFKSRRARIKQTGS
jgi:hypothetical protein